MQKFNTLSDAIALAEFAHRNQHDKAGMPYIEHPRRVMEAVQAQGAMPYGWLIACMKSSYPRKSSFRSILMSQSL